VDDFIAHQKLQAILFNGFQMGATRDYANVFSRPGEPGRKMAANRTRTIYTDFYERFPNIYISLGY
jgi:hypothetical protein